MHEFSLEKKHVNSKFSSTMTSWCLEHQHFSNLYAFNYLNLTKYCRIDIYEIWYRHSVTSLHQFISAWWYLKFASAHHGWFKNMGVLYSGGEQGHRWSRVEYICTLKLGCKFTDNESRLHEKMNNTIVILCNYTIVILCQSVSPSAQSDFSK